MLFRPKELRSLFVDVQYSDTLRRMSLSRLHLHKCNPVHRQRRDNGFKRHWYGDGFRGHHRIARLSSNPHSRTLLLFPYRTICFTSTLLVFPLFTWIIYLIVSRKLCVNQNFCCNPKKLALNYYLFKNCIFDVKTSVFIISLRHPIVLGPLV